MTSDQVAAMSLDTGCGRSPASRPGAVLRVRTRGEERLVGPRSPAAYHRSPHAPGRLVGAGSGCSVRRLTW